VGRYVGWGCASEEEDEERKKEKGFGRRATFWFSTFVMHFSTTGCVVRHENIQR